jgi:hypothetical protein
MKPSELRIDNYINSKDKLSKVIAIGEKEITTWCFKEKCYYRIPFKYFSPIILTEEWLLKIGINKVNNSMFRIDNITFQSDHISEGKTIYDKILSSRKAYKVCVNGKYLCYVEFVHELQNLYLDIKKKELKMKK